MSPVSCVSRSLSRVSTSLVASVVASRVSRGTARPRPVVWGAGAAGPRRRRGPRIPPAPVESTASRGCPRPRGAGGGPRPARGRALTIDRKRLYVPLFLRRSLSVIGRSAVAGGGENEPPPSCGSERADSHGHRALSSSWHLIKHALAPLFDTSVRRRPNWQRRLRRRCSPLPCPSSSHICGAP